MSELQTVRVGDLRVAFRLDGPEDAPVVLMTHGLLTSHALWDDFIAALRGRWRLLRYDLRGHGATTSTPAPYAMRQLAEDAVRLLDALHVRQAHFVGASLGGMIGQHLGARFPERFATLTLANTTAVQGAPAAWQQRIDTARNQGVASLIEPTLGRWFTQAFLASGAAAVARIRAIATSTSADGFIGCAGVVRDLSQSDLLASITRPTLVVVGDGDTATPPQEGDSIHSAIAGSQFVSLPAAHQAVAEVPEAFASAWEAFVHPHDFLEKT